jgi:hypothetical protein
MLASKTNDMIPSAACVFRVIWRPIGMWNQEIRAKEVSRA